VNGGVPQGTLSGPELFLHMVSDLKSTVPETKYVDDTTFVETCKKKEGSNMQSVAEDLCLWSKTNNLNINTSKTKEMVVCFGKEPKIEPIVMNGEAIERVTKTKLLGVIISSDLSWNAHIDYICAKAGKRLHYLRLLKRAGLPQHDLIKVYLAIIRSVVEYACPVWSTSLTKELNVELESMQKQALRIICPHLDYDSARNLFSLMTLKERRDKLCAKLFKEIQNPSHKLRDFIPEPRTLPYSLRLRNNFPLPRCRTSRLKNSFIPWCLYKIQS
jgi:hypothetical protein